MISPAMGFPLRDCPIADVAGRYITGNSALQFAARFSRDDRPIGSSGPRVAS